MSNQIVIELADSIEVLGGTLTTEQKKKLKRIQ
jgi:hypothetical protein